MKKLRVLARVLVVNEGKLLLVRNKGADFWYPPGGGWEYNSETITECAAREVKEETGYEPVIDRLLWVQEFHEKESIFLETFWLATLASNQIDKESLARHRDLDPNGAVEEVRWYKQDELAAVKVFPKRIKAYRTLIDEQKDLTDPFIGTFL